LSNFISSGNHKQVTKTYYDEATPGFSYMSQDNLRKRVSGIEYFDDASSTVVSGVYYTYDIHGNVLSLVRRNEALGSINSAYTRTDYSFDLISSKVNQVDYQKNQLDWFIHRYEYDADNRITDVYSSSDNTFFDHDASYFYYLHGPLSRVEFGEMKVQGLDYVYSLQGWIKGVNSSTLQTNRDPGRDGLTGTVHQNVCRDVTGYNLSYFEGDFKAIGSNTGGSITSSNHYTPSTSGTALDNASPSLYNGNIRHMVTALKPFMYNKVNNTWSSPQAMAYKYDQLNRIYNSYAYSGSNVQATNDWGGSSSKTEYQEVYTYDPNGNILTLFRNGNNTSLPNMDQFTYIYKTGSNQLDHVQDLVPNSNYTSDIDNQQNGNYDYDAIGNLIKDESEEIANIEWTVYGKISKITRTTTSTKPDLEFTYSPDGHRISKKVITKDSPNIIKITYYSLDAQGNQMAIYQLNNDSFVWESSPIYGSSRVGIFEAQKLIVHNGFPVTPGLDTGYNVSIRGVRRYEISNHLGNVLTTVSDRRSMVVNGSGIIQYYEAEIVTATDYYPFGSVMLGRDFKGEKYRFGFNTQEKITELGGDIYTAEFWMYNAQLGRRWNVDPEWKEFANESIYTTFQNNPIFQIDHLGNLPKKSNRDVNPDTKVERYGIFERLGNWLSGESWKNHANKFAVDNHIQNKDFVIDNNKKEVTVIRKLIFESKDGGFIKSESGNTLIDKEGIYVSQVTAIETTTFREADEKATNTTLTAAGITLLITPEPIISKTGALIVAGALATSYIVDQISSTPIPEVTIVWAKGGKKNLYDHDFSPLSSDALKAARAAAKAAKDKVTLEKIKKEEKRRGIRRNTQSRK
jgi:hypothetical protein